MRKWEWLFMKSCNSVQAAIIHDEKHFFKIFYIEISWRCTQPHSVTRIRQCEGRIQWPDRPHATCRLTTPGACNFVGKAGEYLCDWHLICTAFRHNAPLNIWYVQHSDTLHRSTSEMSSIQTHYTIQLHTMGMFILEPTLSLSGSISFASSSFRISLMVLGPVSRFGNW